MVTSGQHVFTQDVSLGKDNELEFYKRTFSALVTAYGRDYALDKVRLYQRLSAQHASSRGWALHSCELLTSYNRMLAGSLVDYPQWPQVSYYKAPISNIHPFKSVTLSQIHQAITGRYYVAATARCRELYKQYKQTGNKTVYRKFKATHLDYVTFSGTFSERSNDRLLVSSGYICLDFDEVKNLVELKKALLQDTYFETQLLFVSPSGAGLKWIIGVDQVINELYFAGLKGYIHKTYGYMIDATPDVSRACFLGHDNESYLNPKFL